MTFESVGQPVINDDGQLVFAATLNDGTEGVWGTTRSGQLRKIIHAGDVIEVGPGDLRVVRDISNFQVVGLSESSAFNNQGEVSLRVRFEDWSQAIIVSQAIALGNVAGSDLNGDGVLDVQDIDHLTRMIHSGTALLPAFDQNNDHVLDYLDLSVYLVDAFDSAIGNSTLDGRFTSDDLLAVFRAGEYEDAFVDNSHWATGDWNGDYDSNSTDIVFAFQAGHYEQEGTSPVPEPSALALVTIGVLFAAVRRRQRVSV